MSIRVTRLAQYLASSSAVFLALASAAAQRLEIPLRAGTRPIGQESTEEFVGQVRGADAGRHGFAMLHHYLTAQDSIRLASLGIVVLGRLAQTIYLVHAQANARFADTAVTRRIRFFAVSEPRDRVAPEIWDGDTKRLLPPSRTERRDNPFINVDSTLNVAVRFHADVPDTTARRILAAFRRSITPIVRHHWAVALSVAEIRRLAQDDAVRWIDLTPVAGASDMDHVREAVHVSSVQVFDPGTGTATGLTGKGVRVGLFESGGIDAVNSDFNMLGSTTSRVVANQATPSSHATHLAGIIGGTGAQSTKIDSWNQPNSGTVAYQWRGIAPHAELLNAPTLESSVISVYRDFIVNKNMALSNHSYWLTVSGKYDLVNRLHDLSIRGDDPGDGTAVPPKLHVHSAGNFGVRPSKTAGSFQRGYFSLGNQLKNALVVGEYYLDAARPAAHSSLGPTYDGRIKPDVMAPGTYVTSAGYCDESDNPPYTFESDPETHHPCDGKPAGQSYPRRNFYLPFMGTSVAAAVTTGVVTLLYEELQDHPLTGPSRVVPLPSTLRAIMIHSANDLIGDWPDIDDGVDGTLPVRAFPGPDFTTGYGLIDAAGAIDVVRQRLVIESAIKATCDTTTYTVFVPEGSVGDVKVTLAWDDPASDASEIASDEARLINDLDLVLIDPVGGKHYPWLLDQVARDTATEVYPDDAQLCGSYLYVERRLKPTISPWYGGYDNNYNDLDPTSNRDDPINDSDLVPAGRGRDHLNNAEQVVAPSMPGVWQVQVLGFHVQQGPQTFSLVGVFNRPILFAFQPGSMCKAVPGLCETRIASLCVRFAVLCHLPDPFRFQGDTMWFTFRDPADRKIIQLSSLCYALSQSRRAAACDPGATARRSPELELLLPSSAQGVGVEIFNARGGLIARDLSDAASKRLRVPAGAGSAFLFIRALGNTRLGAELALPITLREIR